MLLVKLDSKSKSEKIKEIQKNKEKESNRNESIPEGPIIATNSPSLTIPELLVIIFLSLTLKSRFSH